MIKKLNYKRVFFKWLGVTLAVVVNILAIFSWLDVIYYGWPKSSDIWGLLVGNTALGMILIRMCYVNWNIEAYDHYIDKR